MPKIDWSEKLQKAFNRKYEKGRADERLDIMKLLREQDQAWAEYAIGVIAQSNSSYKSKLR